MTLLNQIKFKWNAIGEQLRVEYGVRMSMSTGCNVEYDDTRKLSEVLQVWIDKQTCEVSWKMIITVINDPPVEEKEVANQICDFLASDKIRNEYLLSDQPGKIKMIIIDKVILKLFWKIPTL